MDDDSVMLVSLLQVFSSVVNFGNQWAFVYNADSYTTDSKDSQDREIRGWLCEGSLFVHDVRIGLSSATHCE